MRKLQGIVHNPVFQLGNATGDVDVFRTCLHALENRMATPQTVAIVNDIETFVRAVVPAVENKSIGFQQGGRSQVVLVGPEAGAGCGAGTTENAICGFPNAGKLLGTLQKLLVRYRLVDNHIRLHPLQFIKKSFHVHNQVFNDGETGQGLDL